MDDLPKIILGNLPLLGISYQGEEKDNEYQKRFSNQEQMKVIIRTALQKGVTVFAASSHDFNDLSPLYLQTIQEFEKDEQQKIKLITCIGVPLILNNRKINDYRRWATHLHYEIKAFRKDVSRRYLDDPILNFRQHWKENLTNTKSYKRSEIENGLQIEWKQWENRLNYFSKYNVIWAEPGSEIDFLALYRIDLLGELIDRTRDHGYKILLGSHHFGATAPRIKEKRLDRFDGYVTPINRLGVMMFPTQEQVTDTIRETQKRGKIVIAIKPFAGGRLDPQEALEYVYKEIKADSCMIGVGSVKETDQDIQIIQTILKNKT